MAATAKTDSTPAICTPSRPCNRWRTCRICARHRQAKIADAVENLAARVGGLRWHILHPHQPGQAALRTVRANWLRAAAPSGAIWTVEQSRKTGALHCNIITPNSSSHEPPNAHHWHQTITGNVRNVGAYIAKRTQMPPADTYTGNLYGTAGPLWQLLATQTSYPAVAAAAAQYAIDSHAMINQAIHCLNAGRQKTYDELKTEYIKNNSAPEPTPAEYRAIAARWLPDLLDWKKEHRPRSTLEIAQEFMINENGG